MRLTNLLEYNHGAAKHQTYGRVRPDCTLSLSGAYTSNVACTGATSCGWKYQCTLEGACPQGPVVSGVPSYATQTDCFTNCKVVRGAKCSATSPAIYHANTATKVLRLYSWDTYVSWGSPTTQLIDCTGYTTGPNMPMKT